METAPALARKSANIIIKPAVLLRKYISVENVIMGLGFSPEKSFSLQLQSSYLFSQFYIFVNIDVQVE